MKNQSKVRYRIFQLRLGAPPLGGYHLELGQRLGQEAAGRLAGDVQVVGRLGLRRFGRPACNASARAQGAAGEILSRAKVASACGPSSTNGELMNVR